jgi:choline monooxygenase
MHTDEPLDVLADWQSAGDLKPLPPILYTSGSILEREKSTIFDREWLCVGHVSEIANPGDYLTFDFVDTPIVVTRNRSGALRAFSNVCAHRSARLLDGSGHCAAIVCPYHSWTYDLDGRLRGAPFMDAGRIEGIRLPEIRIETWEGMIFATLDRDAAPLAPRLASLQGRIGGFDIAAMNVVWRFDDEFGCNWKVLVENFCESYHVFRVHRDTLEPDTPTSSVEVLSDGPGFNHHTMDYRANDSGAGKDHLCCIYPATTLAVRQGSGIWLSVRPATAATCRVTGWLAKSSPTEDDVASSIDATKAFLAEDRVIVSGVQKGLASGAGNNAPLSPMEATNWQFGRYIAERLLSFVQK